MWVATRRFRARWLFPGDLHSRIAPDSTKEGLTQNKLLILSCWGLLACWLVFESRINSFYGEERSKQCWKITWIWFKQAVSSTIGKRLACLVLDILTLVPQLGIGCAWSIYSRNDFLFFFQHPDTFFRCCSSTWYSTKDFNIKMLTKK